MDEWKRAALEQAEKEAVSELFRIDRIAEELNVNYYWLADTILKAMKKRLDESKNQ
jgi:hypothetical protein